MSDWNGWGSLANVFCQIEPKLIVKNFLLSLNRTSLGIIRWKVGETSKPLSRNDLSSKSVIYWRNRFFWSHFKTFRSQIYIFWFHRKWFSCNFWTSEQWNGLCKKIQVQSKLEISEKLIWGRFRSRLYCLEEIDRERGLYILPQSQLGPHRIVAFCLIAFSFQNLNVQPKHGHVQE